MVASSTTETLTFLFTDIEGSTRLWEAYPESMGPAVARHDSLLRGIVEANSGHVFKSLGDAIYAAFPDPARAVAAALDAQRALAEENWPLPEEMRVRIALHFGVCEARAGDYFGRPLNRTARLMAIGHGGQILVSESVREQVGETMPPGASLIPLGSHRLRDFTHPERVYGLIHPTLPSSFPPLRSAGRDDLPNNLPAAATSFIGREREMAEVEAALHSTRLLTLTGAGGCGKTRLAIQAAGETADAYRDGVWIVELAHVTDARIVAQTVAGVLGVGEIAGEPPEKSLAAFVRERRLLLLLDNCEHLLEACGMLTDSLLRAGPGLRVLATSREALGVDGEMVVRVPSLTLPNLERPLTPTEVLAFEAPRLFVERARFHRPDFTVTESNASALAALCRRLDGIPLALELAAARVRALTIEQIDARLDDRFRLLTGGSRASLPRQQTLRALVDWSHSLLSKVERTVLRRLGVFVGGWSLEAAEAVLPGGPVEEWEVLDLLSSLVDKSLVQAEESGGETRYRLLETVRQYALEKLLGEEDGRPTREAHLMFFLHLAETASPLLVGADQARWFKRLRLEHDNIRAALEWSYGSERLRLVGAMYWFWHVQKFNGEGLRRLEEAISDPLVQEPSSMLAKALLGAGTLAYWLEDGRQRAFFLRGLGVARAMGDRNLEGRILGNLGGVAVEVRDFPAARGYIAQALAIHRELKIPARLSHQYCTLGFIEREQGHPDLAREALAQAVDFARASSHRYLEAYSMMAMGNVAVAYGHPDAPEVLRAALEIAESAELGPVAAATYAWYGEYHRFAGRLDEAEAMIAAAERAAPDRDRILYEVYLMATRLQTARGDREAAILALGRLLARAEHQEVPADGLEAAAGVLALRGHPKPAAVLLASSAAARERCGMPLPTAYHAEHAFLYQSVRNALEEPEKAFARGTTMSPTEAVQFARLCAQ